MSPAAWEVVFMMVILKLPVAYLCWVVWWAVRPSRGRSRARPFVPVDPDPRRGARALPPRPPRPGPHGSPVRTSRRGGRVATARAEGRR